ncbi:MAG: hypothetical protein JXA11_15830 [Phycisphaerae bacterium]|nr:hypothetical protein [Phycisphaerae bacterium]
MSLNQYRDEAGAFIRGIGATDEPVEKILNWLGEELSHLRSSLRNREEPVHQVYDMLFLIFELAARYDLDLDEQWAQGRIRKKEKYGA